MPSPNPSEYAAAPCAPNPGATAPAVAPVSTASPAQAPTPPPTPPAALTPEQVRSSLRNSINDGLAWSVMMGFGERYVQPFVILHGSTALALAAMSALPGMIGACIQWLAANVVDRVGRRKAIFVWCSRLQALMWAPLCAAIFLPPPYGYALMLAAFVVYVGSGSFGLPAWNSVMGDLVPPATRGRYFGLRNVLIGPTIMIAFLVAGRWLTHCEQTPALALLGLGSKNFGFLVLFAIAGLARLVSAAFLNRIHEPPYHRQPSDDFSLLDFIRRAPRAHFGRFVFYNTLIQFSGGVIGPFFAWYLLGQLNLTTFQFAQIGTVQMLVLFGCQPLWGRLADRVGNKRILSIGGIGVIGIPVLLLGSDNFYYLLAVQVYDGLTWSAYNIAATNYFFDIVTPAKRARCTAYNSLFVTTGAVLGIFVGATIMQFVPRNLAVWGATIAHPFTVVLIVSAVLRLMPNLFLLHSFREWRLTAPHPIEPLRPETHGEGPPV